MDKEERDQFWQELEDIAHQFQLDEDSRFVSAISDWLDRHSLHPGYDHP